MKFIEATERPLPLIERLTTLWEASVRATHHFLSDAEVIAIKAHVPQALAAVPHLILACDTNDRPLAFMGVADGRLEMLFVHPAERGKGIGKALLAHGMKAYAVDSLTVNEQNPHAVEFYRRTGFHTYKRTELDEQGNPYPLLYMRRGKTADPMKAKRPGSEEGSHL